MMTTVERWTELHDSTLESLELRWASGEAVIQIRTGDVTRPQPVIVASSVRRLECDRQMPWGFSISVNEVRCSSVGGDASVLEIEMQSGDIIRIEADVFSLQEDA